MSVPGGKVDKPTLGYDVNLTAVREIILPNILSRRLLTHSEFLELGDIHLTVEMPGVATDRSLVMTSSQPVTVTNMSPSDAA